MTSLKSMNVNFKSKEIIYYTLLFVITIVVFYFVSKDIHLKLAFNGFGPHDYVSQKINPDNYKNNFPNFINIYDNSIITYSYFLLKNYFNIDVLVSVKIIMFLQVFLFVLSCSFLTNTLFNDRKLTILILLILLMSKSAGLDLARFGIGYAYLLRFPLFYVYSISFGLFAISFFVRKKYLLSYLFLSFTLLSHLTMGLFFFMFIFFYNIIDLSLLKNKHYLTGLFIFLLIFLINVIKVLSSNVEASTSLTLTEWINITKIFCEHWYPFVIKSFTSRVYKEFLPFCIIVFGFFISLSEIKLNQKHKKVIGGMIVCFLLTITGIFISKYLIIPTLIKIAFHRTSSIITFISIIYIIHFIYKKILRGNKIEKISALYLLLVIFNSNPGIALFPLMVFVFYDIDRGVFGPIKLNNFKNSRLLKIILYSSFLILILISSINMFSPDLFSKYYNNILRAFKYFNPIKTRDFFVRGGIIQNIHILFIYLMIFGIMLVFDKIKYKSVYVYMLIMFLFISMFSSYYNEYYHWRAKNYSVSKDFYNAQVWAKNNTPISSVFMVNPAHYYGWRDFSERSSFGNLREWLWFPVAYVLEPDILNEGKKRAKEFNVDLDKYLNLEKMNYRKIKSELTEKVNLSYQNIDTEDLIILKTKYLIDYIVIKKSENNSHNFLKPVYENMTYIIYEINSLM